MNTPIVVVGTWANVAREVQARDLLIDKLTVNEGDLSDILRQLPASTASGPPTGAVQLAASKVLAAGWVVAECHRVPEVGPW